MGSSQPAYTAVVFDMDGLLLDSERPIRDAWLSVAATLGVPLSEADYLGVVGLNHVDSWARMLALFHGDQALLATAQRRVDELLEAGPPFAAKPGAARLLRALHKAGIACAVASSTHRDEVHRRLARADLLDHFDAICGGDEVQRGKPNPDLYLLALQRLGATARSTMAFEDSGHGVQAAIAAGLATVAIPDLKAPPPEWLARCIAVLPSLDNACAHADAWFGAICAD